jgi:hypothetical protein
MKLLTAAIRAKLPKLYAQEKVSDPIVHVKFFTPWTGWTWYITEGEQDGDDFRMFGLVEGLATELGYVSLNELASLRGPGGLKIERDLYWSPRPLSQVKGM